MAEKHFPYRLALEWSDEDGAYVARVPALPGCAAHGESVEEATREVLEAAAGILESMRAHGKAEPAPDHARGHSGNIRLRLPRYLHERIARAAEAEGTSLNQLMVALLAQASSASVAHAKLVARVKPGAGARRGTDKKVRARAGGGRRAGSTGRQAS